jgi:hypothetical protein
MDAPVGIPAPSFGIFEPRRRHRRHGRARPGFYYVDASKSGSTDSGNFNGTPGQPRAAIPIDLPPGAVVELHGIRRSHATPATIVSRGRPPARVHPRVSADSRPLRAVSGKSTYLIIENIEFGPLPDRSDTGSLVIRLPASHVALRSSDLHAHRQRWPRRRTGKSRMVSSTRERASSTTLSSTTTRFTTTAT